MRVQNQVESKWNLMGMKTDMAVRVKVGVGLVAAFGDITPVHFQAGSKTSHTEASD